jgi:uncharacterized protein YfdQ (DUF2303 family)
MTPIELSDATIDSITRLARHATEPFAHPQGGQAVLMPDGRIEHLKPVDRVLTRVTQNVKMLDATSFSAYLNRFKRDGVKSTIFADYAKPLVHGIIDYHDGQEPDYLQHQVMFAPPYSEQWVRWRGIDGKAMSQMEFADFIEENSADVVDPDGAVFLDLVTNLHAKKKVAFESGLRLQDGSNQLVFSEEIEAKGKGTMVVPAQFSIGVPVFYGSDHYKVACFLRYRIDEGRLIFQIKINRRTFIEQTAFGDVTKAIGEATGLAILNGSI